VVTNSAGGLKRLPQDPLAYKDIARCLRSKHLRGLFSLFGLRCVDLRLFWPWVDRRPQSYWDWIKCWSRQQHGQENTNLVETCVFDSLPDCNRTRRTQSKFLAM